LEAGEFEKIVCNIEFRFTLIASPIAAADVPCTFIRRNLLESDEIMGAMRDTLVFVEHKTL
jgi:hypothetical protein